MRTYRTGGTMGSLFGWNAIAVPAIVILVLSAPGERPPDRPLLYGIAGILGLMGPVALLAYLVRWSMIRVTVGAGGLTLSERHEVGWSEIRSVQMRGWRPKPWNPFKGFKMNGCAWVLLFVFIKIVIFGLLFVFLLWFCWAVLVPVAVLYSPWHSRVVIELADGSRLVYRDLSFAEEFVRSVRRRIREVPAEP